VVVSSQRKDSYRAALQRTPATPRSSGGFVIRTRPICVTVDLAPGLHRALRRWTSVPGLVQNVAAEPLRRVRRLF
jgi:hypothetical protein